MTDSNAHKGVDKNGKEVIIGLNHEYIRRMVTHGKFTEIENEVYFVDIMDSILSTDVNVSPKKNVYAKDENLVQVIQLCLTWLTLQLDHQAKLCHFDLSQDMAYAHPSKQPIFFGAWKQRVNVQWLLATANFFKLHMKEHGEGLLSTDFWSLDPHEVPQPWLGKLNNETETLGTQWKGAYSKSI